jgi:DNA-directed RNA polymerase specialized sigma24 family protein
MKTITYIASNENEDLFFQNNFTYIASNLDYELDINYNIDNKDIIKKDNFLPISIFSNGISGLEAISKYLKEVKNLRYCEISKLLNRNDRTIWDAYQNAKQKSDEKFSDEISNIQIPVEIFNNRALSILEALTVYLKDKLNLRYCQIASFLNKDDRTIWTAYKRGKEKITKNNKND